ncbi:MAG: DUF4199 domain-containing protein [Prevotella sp.]|nr:DUF4199 domain-containing protein [Prevotella sp.]
MSNFARMISTIELVQLKAYARQDGLILGAIWIAAFACFIGSMSDASLQLGFIVGALCTPFVVFYMLRHYRDQVLTGAISYRRAFAFIAYTMMYASLLLAAATFAYFNFIDSGNFFGTLMSNIKLPEVQQAFTDAGMDPRDIEEQLSLMSQSRPIDFAFSVFFEGVVFALIHAALLSLLGKKRARS